MAHYLVTGGGGFIGFAVCEALAARGDEVTAFDLTLSPALAQLAASCPAVHAIAGDITQPGSLASAFTSPLQGVVHCAAMVGVASGAASPNLMFRVNIQGSLCLLEAMRAHDVPRMIHISSEETYGNFLAERIDETHPQFPLTAYGLSKLTTEQMARAFGAMHDIETINLRTSWVYGPGLPRPRIPKTLLEAAHAGAELHLPSGADFTVDHTYIDDVTAGILATLDLPRHPYDAYNLASGNAPRLDEIIAMVRDLVPGASLSAGPGLYDLSLGAGGAITMRKGALDISRAQAAFGYTPRYSMRDGLAAWLATLSTAA